MTAYVAFVASNFWDEVDEVWKNRVCSTRCFPTLLEASEWAWGNSTSLRNFTEHCWVEFEGQEVKPEDGWHSIFEDDYERHCGDGRYGSTGWCVHWGKPTKGEWI